MKAFGGNLPAALRAKRERGCRVVAYLDEWDGAVSASWSLGERLKHWAGIGCIPATTCMCRGWSAACRECDVRLGTTRFLQNEIRLPDLSTSAWIRIVSSRRIPPRSSALKRELGLQGKKLIVFGGVVRPHKGVEVFAEALAKLGRTDACS